MTFVAQSGGAVDVTAVVTLNSGFVTVTPSVPLLPGASYRLTTADGVVSSEWSALLNPDPFRLDMTVAL